MLKKLEERDWDLLLRRIEDGRCTPFLGAGACLPVLPSGSKIAREWARKYHYPLEDTSDLVRVAQFLALQYDPMFPKEKILGLLEDATPKEDFAPDKPHGVLAELPFPVYITTNYDDFMVQALKSQGKDPKRELCRWNKYLMEQPSAFDYGFRPRVKRPVVFHFHGYKEVPESLVLTEDDYLDFLVNVSWDPRNLLPQRIKEALTVASLLFIGYRLADWSFRVLFRGLIRLMEPSVRRTSFTIQLPPKPADGSELTRQQAQKYLEKYFDRMDLRVYWGTAEEFSVELQKRWRSSGGERVTPAS